MKPGNILLIRADADSQIGTGHIMRCLALAQAWQDCGGEVHVFSAELPGGLVARLQAEGLTLHKLNAVAGSDADADQTAFLAAHLGARWIAVDGYQFGWSFQQCLKSAGLHLLLIDDLGNADGYAADLVLNQNIYADAAMYRNRKAYTQLLLSTSYVLLRREFWPWKGRQRRLRRRAQRVLVTMGGSDPDNITLRALQALSEVGDSQLNIVVVAGPGNAHIEALRRNVDMSPHCIKLVQNVTDMPSLLNWADVALTAGGSTCWETAFMGLPSVVVVLADNQTLIAAGLHDAGCAINLGEAAGVPKSILVMQIETLLCAYDLRRVMAEKGQTLVDGGGAHRVISEMKSLL